MRHGPGEETIHSSEVQTKIRTMLRVVQTEMLIGPNIKYLERSTIEYMPALTRAHD